jgi:predicted metallo-beta-lactamase superfamily hydrolase
MKKTWEEKQIESEKARIKAEWEKLKEMCDTTPTEQEKKVVDEILKMISKTPMTIQRHYHWDLYRPMDEEEFKIHCGPECYKKVQAIRRSRLIREKQNKIIAWAKALFGLAVAIYLLYIIVRYGFIQS